MKRPTLILAEGGHEGERFAAAVQEVLRFIGVRATVGPGITGDFDGIIIATARSLLRAIEGQRVAPEQLDRFHALFVFAGKDVLACQKLVSRITQMPVTAFASPGHDQITISNRERGSCGTFTGLSFGPVSARNLLWFSGRSGLTPLVTGPDQAIGVGKCRNLWFCGAAAPLDLTARIAHKRFDIKRCFFEIAPLLLFFHEVLGGFPRKTSCIRVCLTVDDPLLRTTYGRFRFPEVLRLIEQHKLALNIGFIPWNFRRSDPRIADLIRANPRVSTRAAGRSDIRPLRASLRRVGGGTGGNRGQLPKWEAGKGGYSYWRRRPSLGRSIRFAWGVQTALCRVYLLAGHFRLRWRSPFNRHRFRGVGPWQKVCLSSDWAWPPFLVRHDQLAQREATMVLRAENPTRCPASAIGLRPFQKSSPRLMGISFATTLWTANQ